MMLAELGATPEPATAILLRQVGEPATGAGGSAGRGPAARGSTRPRLDVGPGYRPL